MNKKPIDFERLEEIITNIDDILHETSCRLYKFNIIAGNVKTLKELNLPVIDPNDQSSVDLVSDIAVFIYDLGRYIEEMLVEIY